ncbi:hypothetical protein TEA_007764 [Camellia sinensis var. sinensis]|uniref:DUF3700 domain-containing protein n=1 Tax=Camellia sinensis var. sinensis TaxID=542762 RepID=A0A4S4DYQ0_CAMSN|nr:hypothetical protein TEA_007764 [Camellia sinensis var. sinensis]
MLAVLDKLIAKSPEALQIPHSSDSISALKDGFVAQHFSPLGHHSGLVTINLGASALMAYSIDRQNPLLPRFNTHFPILAYFPAFVPHLIIVTSRLGDTKVLKNGCGHRNRCGTVVTVVGYKCRNVTVTDADKSVPFFWGNDSEGHLVHADDAETVKKWPSRICQHASSPSPAGVASSSTFNFQQSLPSSPNLPDVSPDPLFLCQNLSPTFPPPSPPARFAAVSAGSLFGCGLVLGCFFTSSGGLRNFEHPLNELKPVPRVDSSG